MSLLFNRTCHAYAGELTMPPPIPSPAPPKIFVLLLAPRPPRPPRIPRSNPPIPLFNHPLHPTPHPSDHIRPPRPNPPISLPPFSPPLQSPLHRFRHRHALR